MSELALFPEEAPRPALGPERHLKPKVRPAVVVAESAAKDLGQGRAIAAAGSYADQFARAIKYFTRGTPPTTFTVDDIIGMIGLPAFNGKNTSNAVGALMAQMAKRGLIRSVGWQESTRKGNHARPVRVWIGVTQ